MKLWFGHEWAATKAITRTGRLWTLMPASSLRGSAKSIDNVVGEGWPHRRRLRGLVHLLLLSFLVPTVYACGTAFALRSPSAIRPVGLVCLNLALLFRLWNEIWSNVAVVASFYGEGAAGGGRPRSSLRRCRPSMSRWAASCFSQSDVLQAAHGLFLLFYLLGVVSYEMREVESALWNWQPAGGYAPGGTTALMAALVQGFLSYPFHDPVLTDSTFLSSPRTMLASFFVGGCISIMFIVLFGTIGILGDYLADPPVGSRPRLASSVARSLCGVIRPDEPHRDDVVALDARLDVHELRKLVSLGSAAGSASHQRSAAAGSRPPPTRASTGLWIGRVSIFVLIAGVANLAAESVIKATTVSGTIVMGLGRPSLMLLWRFNSRPAPQRLAALARLPPLLCSWRGLRRALPGAEPRRGPRSRRRSRATALAKVHTASSSASTCSGTACACGCLVGFVLHQTVIKLAPTEEPTTKTRARVIACRARLQVWRRLALPTPRAR